MQDKDAYLDRLMLENDRLRIELQLLQGEHKRNPPCGDCERIERHDCYTLWHCPLLGFVDPAGPGCQKWQEKSLAAVQHGEVGEI